MKPSIFYLGVTVTAFANVVLASEYQQAAFNEAASLIQTEQLNEKFSTATTEDHSRERRGSSETAAKTDVSSEVLVLKPYEKTIQEVIAEDNLIVENAEVFKTSFSDNSNDVEEETTLNEFVLENFPALQIEKTAEETISEDQKIIESSAFQAVPVKFNGICIKKKTLF